MPAFSDDLLDAYDYAADPVLRAVLHAADHAAIAMMMGYGRGETPFGRQMVAHQNRVARDGAAFLRHLGYSERAAKNFRAALLFHDIGKTHAIYKPSEWMLDLRPTADQKAAQKRHARLGAEMFEAQAAGTGLADHPHYAVRHAVTLYHHERLDGDGPEGAAAGDLPLFVQVSCIVDSYDGDRIRRPHQDHRRTPQEALRRMTGEGDPSGKYIGAFDMELLGKYSAFKTDGNVR